MRNAANTAHAAGQSMVGVQWTPPRLPLPCFHLTFFSFFSFSFFSFFLFGTMGGKKDCVVCESNGMVIFFIFFFYHLKIGYLR